MKGVVEVEPEITKEEFERRVLIELAANAGTPVDIFSSSFDGVRIEEEEIAVMRAEVDLNYTCSVGYNREERYYNNMLKSYQNRTVTDWQPFSGSVSGDVNAAVRLGETDEKRAYKIEGELRKIIDSTSRESRRAYESEDIEIGAETERVLKKMCMDYCFKKSALPGDRQRDISYNGNVNVDSLAIWKLPKYSLDYTYGNKTYSASAMATGDSTIDLAMPDNGAKFEKRDWKYFLLALLGVLIWMTGFILYVILPLSEAALTAVLVVLLLVGVGLWGICFYLYDKEKKKREAKCREEKLPALENLLAERNLEPLTQEERNAILNSSAVAKDEKAKKA